MGLGQQKLTITECDSDKKTNDGNCFEVMINPAAFKHNHSICYNKSSVPGKSADEVKFNKLLPSDISFEIVIDGTGVVRSPLLIDDVKTQIKKLSDVVYKYNGENHEPNHVKILWGDFILYGRLTSLSTDYTLFKPSGEPLRAKVSLAFKGFASSKEEEAKANKSSPDLSHIIEVRAGDTLPLLCYQIYKDCSYYMQVARINNLTNFRALKPGTKLHFPPLR